MSNQPIFNQLIWYFMIIIKLFPQFGWQHMKFQQQRNKLQQRRDRNYYYTIDLLSRLEHPDRIRSQIYDQGSVSSNEIQTLIRGIKNGTNYLFDEADDYKKLKNGQPSINCIKKSRQNHQAGFKIGVYQTIQYTLIQCLHLVYKKDQEKKLQDFVQKYLKDQPNLVNFFKRIWPLLVTYFDKRLKRSYKSLILISLSNGHAIKDKLNKLTKLHQKLSNYQETFYYQLISTKPSQQAAFQQEIIELQRCVYYLNNAIKKWLKQIVRKRERTVRNRQPSVPNLRQAQLQERQHEPSVFNQQYINQPPQSSSQNNFDFFGSPFSYLLRLRLQKISDSSSDICQRQ